MPDARNPIRVDILNEGAKLISGDRDVSYGDPILNLGLAGKLKNMCRQDMQRAMHPAELEALDQVLTKVARCFTGPIIKHDNYVDGANYFAIAGEAATRHLEDIKNATKPAPFSLQEAKSE